jgi:hypothetical protein
MTLLTRLPALERDHRSEAERLADWVEAIIGARTPELDLESGA